MDSAKPSIDWGRFMVGGRKDPFTPEEMARAGSDAPSPTLIAAALVNSAVLAALVLLLAPAAETAVALVVLFVIIAVMARWLWWHPWRRPLGIATSALVIAVALLSLLSGDRTLRVWLILQIVLLLAGTMLCFVVTWRASQIEERLLAQAERERALDMVRRLASAQLEPHFLFNTLASLQHWVQTGDPRAAPLLEALTTYLRATLPLFDRPTLAAADELQVIESYLRIMQARLGHTRLQWRFDVQTDAAHARIAPGLLLTLVENAVLHGVEPLLSGGRIELRGARQGDEVYFEVHDNGPGPPADCVDGVGLANARQRLALTAGPSASLTLGAGREGGCRAEIRLPYIAAERTR
jgi:signal transduction histidine kinase